MSPSTPERQPITTPCEQSSSCEIRSIDPSEWTAGLIGLGQNGPVFILSEAKSCPTEDAQS